jgi:hypothetical protein
LFCEKMSEIKKRAIPAVKPDEQGDYFYFR